jgi:predicted secreted protein
MSNAFSGVGTKFRRWSGTQWVAIAEVKSISGPTMSREMIDVTNLDSTGGYREFIPSFRDGGTVTLSMNFTFAGYQALKADFQSDTLVNYEILLLDNTNAYSVEFSGYVQDLPINVTFDDAVTTDVTIKVTGEVTLDSTSGSGSA